MKKLSSVVRWVARAMSLAMVALMLVFVIGEGTPNPMDLVPEERGVFFALAIMTLAGLLAWRFELIGGLIILAGFGMYRYFEGGWPEGYFAIFPLAGCLYLIAWLLEHQPAVAAALDPKEQKSKGKAKRKGKRKRSATGKNARSGA